MRVTIMKVIGILTVFVFSDCWGLPQLSSVDDKEIRPSQPDPLDQDNYDPWAVQAAATVNHHQYQHQQHNNLQHQRRDDPRRPPTLPYNHDRSRYRSGSTRPLDYDPFYFSNTQSNIVPVGSRSRRNSKFISNHLLNEDVHFFRRDPNSVNSVSAERARDEPIFVHERKPMYERRPEEFYEHSAAVRPLTLRHPPDVHHLRGSSRLSSYDGRSYYPPQSNQLDYEAPYYGHGPRYSGHAHGRESPRGETIDGWSVQVGTQLRVHDDGRSRNPGQFYVRDEKPHGVRRYPHHRDRDYDFNRRE